EFFDLSVNPQYYEAIGGIVRNNVVRNTGWAGIGMYASKDSVVANNTIVNAASSAHSAIYFGVTLQDYDARAGRPANVNPKIANNLVIQNNNRCMEIRYSSELGGLSGLSGATGSNWNGYSSGCVFRDGRPGGFGQGNLSQWRSALNADANSKQAAYAVDATGRLPAGSPAINAGTTLAEVADDIDRQSRSVPYDLGADEVVSTQPPPAPIRRRGSQPLTHGSASAAIQPAAAAPGRMLSAAATRSTSLASTDAGETVDAAAGQAAAAAVPAKAGVRIAPPALELWSCLRSWCVARQAQATEWPRRD